MGLFWAYLKSLLKNIFGTKKPEDVTNVNPPVPVKPVVEKPQTKKPLAWMVFIRKHLGSKETDQAFSKMMIPKWSLFGMNLGTIAESWAAWCGLMVAVALSVAGIEYAKDGSLARNWGKYGQKIEWKVDGIPEGAIVHINHKFDCASSSSNHVAFANGDCTSSDLLKTGATIDLIGGNQSNQVKVSTYSAKEICNVRWPKDQTKPGKVLVSLKCSSGGASGGSTR